MKRRMVSLAIFVLSFIFFVGFLPSTTFQVAALAASPGPTDTLTFTGGTCTTTSFNFQGNETFANFPTPNSNILKQFVNNTQIYSTVDPSFPASGSFSFGESNGGPFTAAEPYSISETLTFLFNGKAFLQATFHGTCNGGVVTGSWTTGGGGSGGPARFTDGRLNDQDYGQSAAIYCENGGITVYGYSGKWGGYLAFKVAKADLAKYPAKPAQNTLIKEKFGIRLYKLTSGEYQINAVTDEPGKEYVYRWDGCPTS